MSLLAAGHHPPSPAASHDPIRPPPMTSPSSLSLTTSTATLSVRFPACRSLSIMGSTSPPLPHLHSCPPHGHINLERSAAPSAPWILVFSGGTAFNGVVEELKKFTTHVSHVLPVSDDGGSTAEIVRVLGGPAVGDIRSRCLRLSDESSTEALAVKRLLGYRLPLDATQAKTEWYTIVEGENCLWDDVSGPYRETIRAFLVYFQSQILSRSSEKFCFSNGSIGNFFFAGARIFFQSLDAAIFLFSRVSQIPTNSFVLPAICTNDRLTLGCELEDGTVIRGQNEISHPHTSDLARRLPQSVNKCSKSSIGLPAKVKRIFYMSSEGTNLLHEVFPTVNPTIIEQLKQVHAIVYGMGSLFTSVCPSLVLCGVGEVISQRTCLKIFILNGMHDRETFGMTASDFVVSICNALNRKYGDPQKCLNYPATAYVDCILVPKEGEIHVDIDRLTTMGIDKLVTVESISDDKGGIFYEPRALINAIKQSIEAF